MANLKGRSCRDVGSIFARAAGPSRSGLRPALRAPLTGLPLTARRRAQSSAEVEAGSSLAMASNPIAPGDSLRRSTIGR